MKNPTIAKLEMIEIANNTRSNLLTLVSIAIGGILNEATQCSIAITQNITTASTLLPAQ